MRITTYNIHKSVGLDYRRNPRRILDVINEIDADLVILQEVDRRIGRRISTISRELLASHTDYQVANINIREHSLGWHGNVILMRKHYRVQKSWRIELPVLEPRGAICVDIQCNNISIRCIATHLGLLPRIRKKQVRKIFADLASSETKLPTIIAGDFNEWRKFKGCFDDLDEGFKVIDPKPTFHSAQPIAALDRIILSTDIKLINSFVHQSEKSKIASDHLPLCADLEFIDDN